MFVLLIYPLENSNEFVQVDFDVHEYHRLRLQGEAVLCYLIGHIGCGSLFFINRRYGIYELSKRERGSYGTAVYGC